MSAPTEARKFGIELLSTQDQIASLATPAILDTPIAVVRTKSVIRYPTIAASCFACEPLTILGPEVEGSTGVVIGTGATVYAYNLGSSVPPISTAVIITFVDHRWVFRYDG